MKRFIALVMTVFASACTTPVANSQLAESAGELAFNTHCAECHAPGIGRPGTQQLGWTRGEQFAVLEERSDLDEAYIRAIVRSGLLEMPPFLPSELPDSELNSIAEYLAGN